MQVVELLNGPVQLVGALDIDVSPTGLGPRRLPAWTRPQIPDLFMDAMVASASGVRMRFTTDSDSIELDLTVTSFRYGDLPPRSQVLQLVLDDGRAIDAEADQVSYFVLDSSDPTNVGFEEAGASTIRFADLGAGSKTCELWLPHGATVRLAEMRIDDGAHVERAAPSGRRTWLHYGSSISHCIEAEVPTGTWPAVAAAIGGVDLLSLGLAGQCQLDPFVARTIRDAACDVISAKVGINVVNGDTMRERAFAPAVHGLIDTIREGHPTTPILLVSPIFCPSAEHHPGPTVLGPERTFGVVERPAALAQGALTLVRIREILRDVVALRISLGDTNLHYLDGLTLFGEDDADDLPDLLHPNAAGYVRMGERFAAVAFGPGGALSA